MSYFFLEDMRYGVDLRKSKVTAPPGTLREAVNCHLTRGAEPEKRKAFVQQASLPAGTFGLLSIGTDTYVFGSDDLAAQFPVNGIQYQRLQYGATDMIEVVVEENFNGFPFVGARFSDYAVVYFYNGTQVVGLTPEAARTPLDLVTTASTKLKDNLSSAGYTVTDDGTLITIEKNSAFAIETEAYSFQPSDHPEDAATVVETQPYMAAVAGREPDFRLTVINEDFVVLHSLIVDGAELFQVDGVYDGQPSARLGWDTNASITAEAIADDINIGSGTHGWTAEANANAVELTFNTDTDSLNGTTPQLLYTPDRVLWVDGDQSILIRDIDNGRDPVAEQPQISTIEILTDTTIRAQQRVQGITVSSENDVDAAISASPCPDHEEGKGYGAQPLVEKMFILDDTLVRFSKVGNAGDFSTGDGSGFLNAATDMRQSKYLNGIGNYQGRLVVFGNQDTKIYQVDVDPENDQVIQRLQNLGSIAPDSVLDIGDLDTYFLDVSGIRQLRPKDSSNIAATTDVGSPIDELIQNDLEDIPNFLITKAISLQDPRTARFWCAIKERIYVYSQYTESNVTAWTWYQPGMILSDMTSRVGQIWVRSADTVMIYGGTNGRIYDDSQVRIRTPFMPAGKEATRKQLTAFDGAFEGTWRVDLLMDPNNPDDPNQRITVGEYIEGVTYPREDILIAAGNTTHFAIELIHEADGPAKFMNTSIHLDFERET